MSICLDFGQSWRIRSESLLLLFVSRLCQLETAKTVGFFPQNRFSLALRSDTREAREPYTPVGSVCAPRSRPFVWLFATRKYLNTQKYGLFCSLCQLATYLAGALTIKEQSLLDLTYQRAFILMVNKYLLCDRPKMSKKRIHALEATWYGA